MTKFKPAMWAMAAAPLLLLLLIAGGLRGLAYVQGDSSKNEAAFRKENQASQAAQSPMKPADKATVAELQKAAGGQVAAFQKKDYAKALRYAVPEFQQEWKPDAFGKMIAAGYGELIAAKTVAFGPAQINDAGTTALLPVIVRNAQKQETRFLYILIRTKTGDANGKTVKSPWHISGCQRETPPPPTVPLDRLNEA